MTVAYTVLEYGDLIVAALTASDHLCFIYDVDNDVCQIIDTKYRQKMVYCINDFDVLQNNYTDSTTLCTDRISVSTKKSVKRST